jgi:hypothetical protein
LCAASTETNWYSNKIESFLYNNLNTDLGNNVLSVRFELPPNKQMFFEGIKPYRFIDYHIQYILDSTSRTNKQRLRIGLVNETIKTILPKNMVLEYQNHWKQFSLARDHKYFWNKVQTGS